MLKETKSDIKAWSINIGLQHISIFEMNAECHILSVFTGPANLLGGFVIMVYVLSLISPVLFIIVFYICVWLWRWFYYSSYILLRAKLLFKERGEMILLTTYLCFFNLKNLICAGNVLGIFFKQYLFCAFLSLQATFDPPVIWSNLSTLDSQLWPTYWDILIVTHCHYCGSMKVTFR